MNPEFTKAAHLLRRAGFGATTREIHEAADRGIDKTLDILLNFDGADPELEESLAAFAADSLDLNNNIDDVRVWWLYRMLHSKNPLLEKLTLFWHGHFATSAAKVERSALMLQQIRTLRSVAAAPFREILDAISKDPAMLIWLDGNNNRKGKPNENYARELFELFSLGIGNYTEKDVQGSARAFTGWGVVEGAFHFDTKQHDHGEKTIFETRGNWNGNDVLDTIVAHPSAPKFLALKLCKFFVNDNPSPAYVGRVAEAFRRSGGHLRAVVEAIFRDPEFFAEENQRAIIKSPVEYMLSASRVLDVKIPIRNFHNSMRKMGQALLAPPSVKGWEGGIAWLSSTSLFERLNFALQITATRGLPEEPRFHPRKWATGRSFDSVDDLADALAFDILHMKPTAETRDAIIEYLTPEKGEKKGNDMMEKSMSGEAAARQPLAKFQFDAKAMDTKLRGAARLLLASPEFQLS